MSEFKFFEGVGLNYQGHILKSKKHKNKLQPLFESITNSMESIKIKNEDNGVIKISFKFINSSLFSDKEGIVVNSIEILDNGIGFNDTEFNRFKNIDDYSKGFNNQGSGRIQYLHYFDKSEFESVYTENDKFRKRTFILSKSKSFLSHNSIISYLDPIDCVEKDSYTKLTFKDILKKEDNNYYFKLKLSFLKEEIINHYLYYFCENRNTFPKIILRSYLDDNIIEETTISKDDIPEEDKTEFFEMNYKSSKDDELIEIEKKEKFYIKSFKLLETELKTNTVNLTSKHEIVKGEISKKIELESLKPNDTINGYRYLFLVSSDYIDKKDSDYRGKIEIPTLEDYSNDTSLFKEEEIIFIEDINEQINSQILTMYEEIYEVKEKHKLEIEKLQKMFLIDKKILNSININIQDTDEKILQKVYNYDSKIKAEKDSKLKALFEEIDELNPSDKSYEEELIKKVNKVTKQVPLQNRTSLTQYIARRQIVLDLFEKTLNRELQIQKESKRKFDEKLLHNIIFHQSDSDTENSDLWIIDEEYIYFDGTSEEHLGKIELNGEKLFKEKLTEEEEEYRLKQEGDAKLKRPDILLFPKEGKCIIIEFKDPSVNVTEHLHQINKYASLINNLSKDKFKFNAYYGYFIGENIDIDDIRDNDSDFLNAPHLDFIYRPFKRIVGKFGKEESSLYTEVIKYSTLLKRAKTRNEIFIKKLGLSK